jgi:hypothetical protein
LSTSAKAKKKRSAGKKDAGEVTVRLYLSSEVIEALKALGLDAG